jgi:hypothetical protein
MKTFDELYNLDISTKVKKNNGLDYLNWLDCFLLLKEFDMTPTYDVSHYKELRVSGQIVVSLWVKIGNIRHEITYTDVRSRDFEFIKQRAFVKCVAQNWGLGLKLWETQSDPAVDDKGLKEEIIKICGNLIGPKFEDNEALMNHIFGLPIGQKISAIKAKDRDISFGKFIESAPVEDRQELLKILKSLVSIDEPF